ncbi:MAG: hypothetical protein HYS26_02630 [Candidatus Kaiserbacteria bacterium]|nr:MAG: hypothetical protein HYS26_02630 [Candidatus Kaiserbacteria bacterium]
MRHISTNIKKTFSKTRATERGELMEFFCHRLNIDRIRDGLPKITMGRMGKLLEGVPTKDLYYLKTVCEEAKHFSKRFWFELNPEKYTKK